MTNQREARERKVFQQLASIGKYLNTGKVLIGITHVPRPPQMSQDAELIQSVLLGTYRPMFTSGSLVYAALLVVLIASLSVACRP